MLSPFLEVPCTIYVDLFQGFCSIEIELVWRVSDDGPLMNFSLMSIMTSKKNVPYRSCCRHMSMWISPLQA